MIARMGNKCKTVLATVAAAVIFLVAGSVCDAAYNIKKTLFRVSAVAGETLTSGDVVCIKDADGKAYKADANDAALRPAMGVIGRGGASGTYVEIIVIGIMTGWSGLSEGANGYLSETAGAVTQSAPTYSQPVAVALNTTDYLFNFRNYFDTSAVQALGVLSGASPIVLEGATANDFETTIAVTDPTADRTVTIPDASGTAMLSTLATNAPDAANAVTGASNGLVFEGATANDFETTITATDPTADRTVTIPDKNVTLESAIKTVTADANGKTIGAAETGDVQSCGGAGVWNLPEASTCVGCIFHFVVTAAQNVDVNPDDGDQIIGLTNAAGDAVRCAAIGGTLSLLVVDNTNIAAFASYCPGGAWADIN